jgi:hypothetical protein
LQMPKSVGSASLRRYRLASDSRIRVLSESAGKHHFIKGRDFTSSHKTLIELLALRVPDL